MERSKIPVGVDLILLSIISGIALLLVAFGGLSEDRGSLLANLAVPSIILAYSGCRFIVSKFQIQRKNKMLYTEWGLVAKFSNLHVAVEDMKLEFTKAKTAKFFLQIGRYEFGGGKPSNFYQLALDKRDSDAVVCVLHASPESPHLSEQKAKQLKRNQITWRKNISQIKTQLEILKENGVNIEVREHKEPFLWRLFIMDDVAYVSGYFHQTKNDEKAAVYKFKNHENSLFKIFDKYFDVLWQSYEK